MHCPNEACQATCCQTMRGERFNTTSFTVEGLFRCEKCRCEYTEKASGRIVITSPGWSHNDILHAMHAGVFIAPTSPVYNGMS